MLAFSGTIRKGHCGGKGKKKPNHEPQPFSETFFPEIKLDKYNCHFHNTYLLYVLGLSFE